MPGPFESVVGGQLRSFHQELRNFVRRTLVAAGNRFRARFIRGQLSFPAGRGEPPRWLKGAMLRLRRAGRGGDADALLQKEGFTKSPSFGVRKVTGRLIKSCNKRVQMAGNTFVLEVWIGRGAPYAEDLEAMGKIAFRARFEQEVPLIEEELCTGLEFLAANPGKAGQITAGLVSEAEEALTDAGGATGQEFGGAGLAGRLAGHFRARRDLRGLDRAGLGLAPLRRVKRRR